MGTKVELSDEADTIKSLVADSRTRDWYSGGSPIHCGCLSDHFVETYPLHSHPASVKSLARGEESGIGVRPGNQTGIPITRADESSGNASPIIHRVPHPLQP